MNNQLSRGFEWRDRHGDYINIKNMPTKRLFYTWLMIYNHSVPKEYRRWNTHRYTFDKDIYHKEYISEAIVELYQELKIREDLGYLSKKTLEEIEVMHKKKLILIGMEV